MRKGFIPPHTSLHCYWVVISLGLKHIHTICIWEVKGGQPHICIWNDCYSLLCLSLSSSKELLFWGERFALRGGVLRPAVLLFIVMVGWNMCMYYLRLVWLCTFSIIKVVNGDWLWSECREWRVGCGAGEIEVADWMSEQIAWSGPQSCPCQSHSPYLSTPRPGLAMPLRLFL